FPFPEETTIESAVNNWCPIRQVAFPGMLDRLAASIHYYLKGVFRIALVDAQNPGLHCRCATGKLARLPVENPFTAEVRLIRRVHKRSKELGRSISPQIVDCQIVGDNQFAVGVFSTWSTMSVSMGALWDCNSRPRSFTDLAICKPDVSRALPSGTPNRPNPA